MRLRFRAALFAAGVLAAAGCESGKKLVPVSGTVTFQGQPVGEGTIQFNDEKAGYSPEIDLRPDGGYDVMLYPAIYKVVVLPPYLDDRPGGMPNPKFKKVNNIPQKYRSTSTSGLVVEVGEEKSKHDITLMP